MRSSASGGARLTSSRSSHEPSCSALTSAPSTNENAKPPSDAASAAEAEATSERNARHSACRGVPPVSGMPTYRVPSGGKGQGGSGEGKGDVGNARW